MYAILYVKKKEKELYTLRYVDVRSGKSTCSWSVVVEERGGGGSVSWRGREVTNGCYKNLLLFNFLCYTAIIKLNYCWYDVKHQTINQSISGISSHSVWPRMKLGNVWPRMKLGNVWPRMKLGNVWPRMKLGNVWPRMKLGNVWPRMKLGNVWPRMN